MGKDPAFLFYPNDWLGGTLGMTFEEKGAYMEVLMMQFNRGHMEGHMIGQVVGQNWDKIKSKFVQDGNGLWFNKRLEEEKMKREKFTLSRRNNINGSNQYSKKDQKKGGHMKAHTSTHMDGHTTSHMENENENENVNKIRIGGVGERVDRSNYLKVLEKLKSDELFVEGLQKRGKVDLIGLETLYDKFFAKHLGEGKEWPSESELRKHLGNYVEKVGPTIKKEEEFKPKTVRIAN